METSRSYAKSRLANPGCPNFHLSLLYVGDDADGASALSEFVSGVKHFSLKPCADSSSAIRRCWTELTTEVMTRVEIVKRTTMTKKLTSKAAASA